MVDRGKTRVLIVDDEAASAAVLSRWLAERGFGVEAVASAEDAVALLKNSSFDAILMDVGLPGMSGMRAVLECSKVSPAPVILMTGYADAEIERDALMSGAKLFLTKPVELSGLVQAIERVLPGAGGPAGEGDYGK